MGKFFIGQEVVFVDPGDNIRAVDGLKPSKLLHGRIYVIADFDLHEIYHTGVGIIVKGRPRDAYDLTFFRPVFKTNISIFTAMLVTPHERVPA